MDTDRKNVVILLQCTFTKKLCTALHIDLYIEILRQIVWCVVHCTRRLDFVLFYKFLRSFRSSLNSISTFCGSYCAVTPST